MKKFCPKCEIEHDSSKFTKDKSTSDGFYYICKGCKRLAAAVRYKLNSIQREKTQTRGKMRRVLHRGIMQTIKSESGCASCGENSHYCVLDFHHVVDDKHLTIGQRAEINIQKIIKEILKCICLCSNCHRKVHANVLDVSNIPTISQDLIDKALILNNVDDINNIIYNTNDIPTTKCWVYHSMLDIQIMIPTSIVHEYESKGYVLGIRPRGINIKNNNQDADIV